MLETTLCRETGQCGQNRHISWKGDLTKLTQEGIENLIGPIAIKEIEFIIKYPLKTPGQMALLKNSISHSNLLSKILLKMFFQRFYINSFQIFNKLNPTI